MNVAAELEQYVDEARAMNKQLARYTGRPARTLAQVRKARAWLESPDSPFAVADPPCLPVEARTVPGPAGEVPVRVIRPEQIDAVYLDLHGGGWVMGSAAHGDAENAALAVACRVAVVSVEYRLAPEHPCPAGPDDCEAAARWLVEHGARELGAERLVIGGASAGAHLAVVTLLRLREHEMLDAFVAANLVFGVYDLSLTPGMRAATDGIVVQTDHLQALIEHFTPGLTAEQRRAPAISPLYHDLRGLPPALFTVGTLDGLLDDSLFMAARWQAAGNDCELAIYPESPHAFLSRPTAMARAGQHRIQAWLRSHIDAAPRGSTT